MALRILEWDPRMHCSEPNWFRIVQQTHTSKNQITYAATPTDELQWCILINWFNHVTLASSYNMLPDDGDKTETCWSFLISINDQIDAQNVCFKIG